LPGGAEVAGQDADLALNREVAYITIAWVRWVNAARGMEHQAPNGNVVCRVLCGKAGVDNRDRGHMHRGRVLITRQVEPMVFAPTVVHGWGLDQGAETILAQRQAEVLRLAQGPAGIRASAGDNWIDVNAAWVAGTLQSGADYRKTIGNKGLLGRMEVSKASDAVMHRGRAGTGWIIGNRLSAEE